MQFSGSWSKTLLRTCTTGVSNTQFHLFVLRDPGENRTTVPVLPSASHFNCTVSYSSSLWHRRHDPFVCFTLVPTFVLKLGPVSAQIVSAPSANCTRRGVITSRGWQEILYLSLQASDWFKTPLTRDVVVTYWESTRLVGNRLGRGVGGGGGIFCWDQVQMCGIILNLRFTQQTELF